MVHNFYIHVLLLPNRNYSQDGKKTTKSEEPKTTKARMNLVKNVT